MAEQVQRAGGPPGELAHNHEAIMLTADALGEGAAAAP
eukprot:COSAG01_NODE_12351_length_1754_cov_1.861631_2_plen_38_part_00